MRCRICNVSLVEAYGQVDENNSVVCQDCYNAQRLKKKKPGGEK